MSNKLIKTEQEWQAQLSPLAYQITRKSATEPAFTGPYWNCTAIGTYHCICCDTPLFKSDTKFDAGCGWPSYFAAINETVITETKESYPYYGMYRTEITCTRCDAHLGHVFTDGPKPSGLRYCVNGNSLRFKTL